MWRVDHGLSVEDARIVFWGVQLVAHSWYGGLGMPGQLISAQMICALTLQCLLRASTCPGINISAVSARPHF